MTGGPPSALGQTARLLQRCELLESLNDHDLKALSQICRSRHVDRGTLIFGRGEPAESMMLVVEGRVRISSVSLEGREVILNEIGPGQSFGEIALLDHAERTADATAVEDTKLLVLYRREFEPFLRARVDLCLELMRLLCFRLRRTTEQVEDLALRSLESRLARVMLALGEQAGVAETHGVLHIPLALSQRELGEITGATRESINKTFRLWRDMGLAELQGKIFEVRDPQAFGALVDRL
ncbi:MAG: Crp/Fnr family transcriptional regulator [Alphaproteobacteria bacterium]|nr:Crp/Fnr family transcriptional regulator [Alphaproteobacteria bacterium]